MGHTNVSSALFSYIHHTSTTQKPIFPPQSHEKHQDEQLHIKTEKTPQRAKEWANQRKTQHPQQKTMQEHNAERKTIGRHSRKTQHRKIAENENRAHNNQTDTGRIGKQFLFSPFLPSETRKDTRIGKYTQRKRKPLRGKENG